ncbi:MAG TPA: DeoR/GlpR family DNA-binding transcription regulator [Solirubrobacteraceae bacterium]|jgi:DeoR/GlpR family transcriptional regulator of sugar metabolism|nr:DeoR/GlpR family DNA-binding transcription regulator [Solirubrobacteraceae bacterium]
MLTVERQTAIVELLRQRGRVLANDLSAELGVSADTIRRDLRELDELGLLRRVHGGALPRTGDAAPFAARARRAPEAKASIARRAAELIHDGQVVILDGGTTTVEVARALRPNLRATIVTTSPPVAVALSEHHGVDIAVIGGTLRRDALVTVGAETVDALRMIRADVVMLGVCGLHPELGVTANDLEETQVKRAMINGAAAVVALADHDKLGTARPVFVAPIDVITALITDSDVNDQSLDPYRAAGIEVLYA